ncbi:MAG TPA: hypothetical protein VH599_18570 [Ktedonobacterales bacterium]
MLAAPPSRRLNVGLLVRWAGGRTLALAKRWPPRRRRYGLAAETGALLAGRLEGGATSSEVLPDRRRPRAR